MGKAMKAMKAAKAMTATAAYQSVAETTGLKSKDVKGVMEALVGVAAGQLKKSGSFKIAGALNLKLKSKPATPARKGVNPFTKEPCVFNAKPASKTVKALPMKKLKELVRSRWAVSPGPDEAMYFIVASKNSKSKSLSA